jgi:hypothetical protein
VYSNASSTKKNAAFEEFTFVSYPVNNFIRLKGTCVLKTSSFQDRQGGHKTVLCQLKNASDCSPARTSASKTLHSHLKLLAAPPP